MTFEEVCERTVRRDLTPEAYRQACQRLREWFDADVMPQPWRNTGTGRGKRQTFDKNVLPYFIVASELGMTIRSLPVAQEIMELTYSDVSQNEEGSAVYWEQALAGSKKIYLAVQLPVSSPDHMRSVGTYICEAANLFEMLDGDTNYPGTGTHLLFNLTWMFSRLNDPAYSGPHVDLGEKALVPMEVE
jgi:hypothetical protein